MIALIVNKHEHPEQVKTVRRMWTDGDGSVLYDLVTSDTMYKTRVWRDQEFIFRKMLRAIRNETERVVVNTDTGRIEWGGWSVELADIEE
jgi:hypothetical protein